MKWPTVKCFRICYIFGMQNPNNFYPNKLLKIEQRAFFKWEKIKWISFLKNEILGFCIPQILKHYVRSFH